MASQCPQQAAERQAARTLHKSTRVPGFVRCGFHSDHYDIASTSDWRRVTCGRCLRAKPKERAP